MHRILLTSTLLLLAAFVRADAAASIYPNELYSGINPIGISESDGIRSIEIRVGDRWRPVRKGLRTRYWSVVTAKSIRGCPTKGSFALRIDRIDLAISVRIRVTSCDGNMSLFTLRMRNTWNLFHEDYGTVTTADRPCHTFSVVSDGGDFTVERIESPSGDFTIHYPFRKPPIRIRGSRTYRYSVCFRPRRPGRVKVPIYVHIRREQPVGKYTTYIVADTAYVRVIPTSRPADPDPIPDPDPIYIPPPKPDPPRPPRAVPEPPPPAPAGATIASPREPGDLVPLDAPRSVPDLPDDTAVAVVPEMEPPIFDPTTFRRILTPSARSLRKGEGFVGSYGLTGLVAGYVPVDRLTVIAGGAWVPPDLAEFSALTAGAKYTLVDEPERRLAVGLQVNRTSTEASAVTSIAPFVTAEIGTLDYGVGATLGYSWRRHLPSDTTIAPFERRAAIVGLGGEVRVARHWKLAGEAFWIDGADFEPVALTARWFNDRLAIDAGVLVDGVPADGVQVYPVLSGIWTFGGGSL